MYKLLSHSIRKNHLVGVHRFYANLWKGPLTNDVHAPVGTGHADFLCVGQIVGHLFDVHVDVRLKYDTEMAGRMFRVQKESGYQLESFTRLFSQVSRFYLKRSVNLVPYIVLSLIHI